MSKSTGLVVKPWAVTVEGYPCPQIYYTRTRGRALADAWRCDAFGAISFKDFLKISRCRKVEPHSQFGDELTVEGKPAFFIEKNRAYVRVAMPYRDHVSNIHPSDILPERYRPIAYRTAKAIEAGTAETQGSVHESAVRQDLPKDGQS